MPKKKKRPTKKKVRPENKNTWMLHRSPAATWVQAGRLGLDAVGLTVVETWPHCLDGAPTCLRDLAHAAGLPMGEVVAELLRMETAGTLRWTPLANAYTTVDGGAARPSQGPGRAAAVGDPGLTRRRDKA